MTGASVRFEPPGPGGWRSLADHFPGALTPEYQRLYAETCPPGMTSYFERYGVLADSLEVRFVHGHLYITPVPLAGPRELRRTPPAAAVWLMARVHPAFRRRTRAANRTLADRPWRAAATDWFDRERARWIERITPFDAADPADLPDDQLVSHLRAVRALLSDGYRRHFELHGDDLLPIGLLIARCAEWGIAPTTATAALADVPSPVAGDDRPPWQLATGYDLDSLSWRELGISGRAPTAPPVAHVVDLRPLVPADDHGELAELIVDARAAVPLRDDNGMVIGAWPMGLLRRAMLAAGRRLGLDRPSDAVEATVDELVARLERTGGPTDDELAARRVDRASRSRLEAPPALGPEFVIPPLGALPRPLALIGAAQLAAADHTFGVGGAVGIGSEPYRGRAVVVDDPAAALDLIEPGDVVVTTYTSPAWNSVLALAGSIVTTTGGLVSHAAVIARELGIPAVVGDPTASARFETGQTVEVDPVAARVVAVRGPGSDQSAGDPDATAESTTS